MAAGLAAYFSLTREKTEEKRLLTFIKKYDIIFKKDLRECAKRGTDLG